jgi:hypothetical protein
MGDQSDEITPLTLNDRSNATLVRRQNRSFIVYSITSSARARTGVGEVHHIGALASLAAKALTK